MSKGAEAAEVVSGEREEVDAVVEEELGVGDGEFAMGAIGVNSKSGFRIG